MRQPRILGSESNAANYYHCVSRAIERRFIFDDREGKERFRDLVLAYARFTGIHVLTYCVMGNHFHLLLEVPRHDRDALAKMSDQELLGRLACIYSGDAVAEFRRELMWRKEQGNEIYRTYRESFERRMCDLPTFMRELKQRYTLWFNRRMERIGPLWEDRYKSVLVEANPTQPRRRSAGSHHRLGALLAMAAYIDLNPVRAGIVDDPKNYRWCGYAEAVGGRQDFRHGLDRVVGDGAELSKGASLEGAEWREIAARYRKTLVQRESASAGGSERKSSSDGFSSLAASLRRRIRHFSNGLALGSEAFLADVFSNYRAKMRVVRKVGSRRAKGLDLFNLRVLRDVRNGT